MLGPRGIQPADQEKSTKGTRTVAPGINVPISVPPYEDLALYPAYFVDLVEQTVPLVIVEQGFSAAVDNALTALQRTGIRLHTLIIHNTNIMRVLILDVLRIWRPEMWPILISLCSLLVSQLAVAKAGTAAAEVVKSKLAECKTTLIWDFVAILASVATKLQWDTPKGSFPPKNQSFRGPGGKARR